MDPNERSRLRKIIKLRNGDKSLLGLSDEELDKALRLIKEENGILVPTVTGMLLIGKEDRLEELMPTAKASFQVLEGTQVRLNEQYSKPLLAGFRSLPFYKNVLGKDVPVKSFAEFQELKYNKVDEWKLTKYDYKLRNKVLKDPSLALKNSDALIVDEKKYTMYLFNPESKDGYPKGKAFESRLGYSAQNYADLDKLIKNNIGKYPINNRQETPHGEKCDVNMVLKGLKDKRAKVKAVVIYDKGQENPRLVTMYIDKLQDGDLKDD